MRSVALATFAVAILLLSGCSPYESTTAGGVVTGSGDQMQPLESPAGTHMRLASGWRVREQDEDSIRVISDDGDSELVIARELPSRQDYASRAGTESDLLRSQRIAVAGPVDTRLFGKPAVAFASSGPEYSRIGIASQDWSVRVSRQAPFDAGWAQEISGMLAGAGEGPEIPSLE